MSKLKDDIINMEVRSSGFKKVQDDILQTSKRIDEHNESIKKLVAQKNRLTAAGKQGSAEFENTVAEIKKLKAARDQEVKTQETLIKNLNLSDLSYNQVKKRAAELAAELRKTSKAANPEKYAELEAQYGRMTRQMAKMNKGLRQVNQEVEKVPSVWNNAFSKIKEFGPAIVVGRGIEEIGRKTKDFIQNSVVEFRKYDEALVDAMKTTELSKDEIKDVSAELAKIDTRTSQNDLLGLARVAGKLGEKTKEAVIEFVEAGDIISVALKEDLGGDVEGAINEVGKLVDIFDLKKEFGLKQSMHKVASSINVVGASSTANEGYIVDFNKRIAGIAPNADIAIDRVIGLAATLDKYGQQSETSATVYGQTINKMFVDPAKYAKFAGMKVKEFIDLLNSDANAAFIALLKGLRGNDAAMMSVANNLDDMNVKGSRGVQVLGVLVKNVDELENQQKLANKAFNEGTSVIDEFNTKNSSAEAQAEKNKKAITEQSVILGEKLLPVVNSVATGLIYFTKVLSAVIGYLVQSKATIITVTAAIVIYNAQKKLAAFYSAANGFALRKEALLCAAHTAAMKTGTATTATYTLAQKALIVVKALLAGQFKAVGIAVKSFIKSIGPIGWIITAVSALAIAWDAVKGSLNRAAASQKALTDINNKAQDSIIAEKVKLELLLKVAQDKTASDKRRLEAMKELQQIVPNGIDLINQETIANGKAKNAVDEYCKSLLVRAKIEAAKEYLVDYEKKRLQEKQEDGVGKELSWYQIPFAMVADFFTQSGGKTGSNLIRNNETIFDKQTEAVSSDIVKYITDLEKANDKTISNKTSNSKDKCDTCGKAKTSCTCGEDDKKKKKWALDSDAEFLKKRSALKDQFIKGQIATDEQYNQQLLAAEMSTLEARIASGKEKGEDLLKLKEQLLDKQFAQSTAAKKREEALLRAAQGGDDEATKAKREYDERRKELGLFNKAEQDMTAAEKAALLQINKEYNDKLSQINLNNLSKEIATQKQAIDRKVKTQKATQNAELLDADTFEKKKALVAALYKGQKLGVVTSEEEAVRLIRAKYAQKNEATLKADLEELLKTYKKTADEIEASGGLLKGVKLSEEDQQKYLDIIATLREELNTLNEPDPEKKTTGDAFGMDVSDWETLVKNTENGKTAFEKMVVAAQAIGAAFNDISNLLSAIEERDFKTFEKSQNKKKKALDKQLKAGQISQEQYSERVQQLDEQTDAKREEMERKQAERQKMLAIFNAIISTAVAVAGALGGTPIGPWNIALAAIIGALGAVQIATIVAQPLPGAEQGGMLVERAQDGKRFDALYEPQRRGAVDRPTVLVGENGTEYVVPAEGYANPTIRPVLDMIEQARQQGQLKQLNLPALMMAGMVASGRASGGYISQPPVDTSHSFDGNNTQLNDSETKSLLVVLKSVLDKLSSQLDNPIKTYTTVAGEGGIAKQLDKYNRTKSRTTIG